MSTRSQLRFQPLTTATKQEIAQVYRHSDGYPDAVLPALKRLKTVLQTTQTDRGPAYAAATFIHLEKCRMMRYSLIRGRQDASIGPNQVDILDIRNWTRLDQPSFLMGYGVEDPSRGIHGDEEYLYMVELPEYDFINPAETGDWHVKVSEHCGFPRWDDPTNHAFERADWQYEGPLEEAITTLGIDPKGIML